MSAEFVGIAWRKSSRSGGEGQSCVEVAIWRKSSHSGTSGAECVEFARAHQMVLMRDSKHPEGGVLAFTPAEWRTFRRSLVRLQGQAARAF